MSALRRGLSWLNQQVAEMIFKDDWHIHTKHSCDDACMSVADLINGTDQKASQGLV
jgi:hypothetical protein